MEYDAKIFEQIPDRRFAWQSIASDGFGGVLTFAQLGLEETKISLDLRYAPKGLVEKLGTALGVMSGEAKTVLVDFKAFIEAQGQKTGAWRARYAASDPGGWP